MAPVVCLLWEESSWAFFFCGNFPLAPLHCSQNGRRAICKAPSKLLTMKYKLQTSDQGRTIPAHSAGNDGSCWEKGRKAQWPRRTAHAGAGVGAPGLVGAAEPFHATLQRHHCLDSVT